MCASWILQNDSVRYANQPIAVVIGETLEAATEGAVLLAPRYETLPALIGLDAGERYVPAVVGAPCGDPARADRPGCRRKVVAAGRWRRQPHGKSRWRCRGRPCLGRETD